jgi:hypothetical protein
LKKNQQQHPPTREIEEHHLIRRYLPPNVDPKPQLKLKLNLELSKTICITQWVDLIATLQAVDFSYGRVLSIPNNHYSLKIGLLNHLYH